MVHKKPGKYPWSKWFARGKFRITRGKEFTCQIHSMVAQIRNVASALGKSVSIATNGNSIQVVVK
jgi:hypothetical protein